MLSPIMLGALVLKNATEIESKVTQTTDPAVREELLNELAGRVITPYIIIGIVLILLAVLIQKSTLPEIAEAPEDPKAALAGPAKTSVFQFPHLVLGILCLFLYVGVEVMAGDAIGAYGRELGMKLDETKYVELKEELKLSACLFKNLILSIL